MIWILYMIPAGGPFYCMKAGSWLMEIHTKSCGIKSCWRKMGWNCRFHFPGNPPCNTNVSFKMSVLFFGFSLKDLFFISNCSLIVNGKYWSVYSIRIKLLVLKVIFQCDFEDFFIHLEVPENKSNITKCFVIDV